MDERWAFFTVDFQLTNVCGQNCLFCPRDRLTRPAGFLETAVFATIAPQLAELGSRVTFCGMGNPLLHPDLNGIATICQAAGLHYGLTIQAPALTDAGLQKLAVLQPAFVEISFPTLSQDLFPRLYPDQNIEDSLAGLHNLVRMRNGNRGLVINVIKVAGETMADAEITTRWKELGFECRLQQCHSRGGNLIAPELINSTPRPVEKCGLFSTHSFITWQGRLLACCHDLRAETQIADLTCIRVNAAARQKMDILATGMPFALCGSCDEPAAGRPVPDRPFPASPKARSRYLKNLCLFKQLNKP